MESSTLEVEPILGEHMHVVIAQLPGPDLELRDDRQAKFGAEIREAYRPHLRRGHEFDDDHRRFLGDLQAEQARRRNRPDGYWIA